MLSGPGLGKFHQAVLMSGAASSTRTIEQASELTGAVLDALGAPSELKGVARLDLAWARAAAAPGAIDQGAGFTEGARDAATRAAGGAGHQGDAALQGLAC